jgi:DNA-binding NarL/FixJ family response regulator
MLHLIRTTWNVAISVAKKRVLIAEQHPVMREGLRAVLDQDEGLEVVAGVATGKAAIKAFSDLQPDVVVMDISIQDTDVLQTIREVRQFSPSAIVVLMSTYPDDPKIRQALELGACSWFVKTATGDEIVREIFRVSAFINRSY